jgi:hypothetical protein
MIDRMVDPEISGSTLKSQATLKSRDFRVDRTVDPEISGSTLKSLAGWLARWSPAGWLVACWLVA